jgi:D-glycero-alpha-D-manno-heptose-7-phosphate kinase
MLFFTGSAHHSWTILEEQEHSTRNLGSSSVKALKLTQSFVNEMHEALNKSDLTRFGALLDAAWQAKKQVSSKISTSRIDHLYRVARDHGALGGKITGAGGGGFLLLCCDLACQSDVRGAMVEEGVREMTFAFDSHGTQIIANDPFIDGDDAAGSRWTFVPVAFTT